MEEAERQEARKALLRKALQDPEFHRAKVCKRPLFWPQAVVAKALERAIDARDGRTVVVRSSRQTMKNEVAALIHCRALIRYAKTGGCIVRTAPTYQPQIVNSKRRLKQAIALDPLIEDKKRIHWGEANTVEHGLASVQFLSLDPTAKIEGATASLALDIDEAHLTDEQSFLEKARPMTGFFASPKFMWGTAAAKEDMLYRTLCHNMGGPPAYPGRIINDAARQVFQFPASLWCDLHPPFRKDYEEIRAQLGADHPTILTQYDLVDVESIGGYLTQAQTAQMAAGDHPPMPAPRGAPLLEYVAVIDIAGEAEQEELDPNEMAQGQRDSTICWILECDWTKVHLDRPLCRIVAAHWWVGKSLAEDPVSRLPGQQELLLKMLQAFRVSRYVVDARGVGEQVAAYLTKRRPGGEAYKASSVTVSEDCLGLLAMLNNDRIKLWQGGDKETAEQREIRAELLRQCGWTKRIIHGHELMKITKPGHGKHIDMVKALTYLPRCLKLPRSTPPRTITSPLSQLG
jgi:hypothetical protein